MGATAYGWGGSCSPTHYVGCSQLSNMNKQVVIIMLFVDTFYRSL